jgi:hypoxanthine phosphoribosyltransferase
MKFKTIITEDKLQQRISELAAQINQDYADSVLDIVYFVHSASTFCTDLVAQLNVSVRVHAFAFDTYQANNILGEVCITRDIAEPIKGRNVLVLEGIVVSGRTPRYILDFIQLRQPASLALCALGVKKNKLSTSLPLRYIGFELGSEVVTGYGMGAENEKKVNQLITVMN